MTKKKRKLAEADALHETAWAAASRRLALYFGVTVQEMLHNQHGWSAESATQFAEDMITKTAARVTGMVEQATAAAARLEELTQ